MKSILTFMACLILCLMAFTIPANDPIDQLIAALQKWSYQNPREKVYLHTDRPYYAVGDTIWFKAYVTIGSKHQLSAKSGALYVDLINEGDSIAKTLRLPLQAGITKGEFVLPDSNFHEGNYRLRAYTNWMRNAGPDYFYDRTFSIGNSLTNPVFASVNYQNTRDGGGKSLIAIVRYTDRDGQPYKNLSVDYEVRSSFVPLENSTEKTDQLGELRVNIPQSSISAKGSHYLFTRISLNNQHRVTKSFPIKAQAFTADIQFFPEGGRLLTGFESKIAFKATGVEGLGLAVQGTIRDQDNNEVTSFVSRHAGMGFLKFRPEEGKTYHATARYPDGSETSVPLPPSLDQGYGLAVAGQQGDSLNVLLMASPAELKNGSHTMNILSQSGGSVYDVQDIIVEKAVTRVKIPVGSIPSGILQLTLLNPAGQPLNERVFFLQQEDQMKLSLSGLSSTARKRQKMTLELQASDQNNKPVIGSFSVSVISENAVPVKEAQETTILSQLLLSSEVRGYIEQPNYYFAAPSQETASDLDVLMLTQGYRQFEWKNLLEGKSVEPVFKAEKLKSDITGRLMSLGNIPIAGGKVMLLNNRFGELADTVSDKQGYFKFSDVYLSKGVEFSVQGRTADGGKKLQVLLDKQTFPEPGYNKNKPDLHTDIPRLLKSTLENTVRQDQDLQQHGLMGRIQLREVQIKASRKWGFGNTINESQADQVFRPDSRKPCSTLKECLEEMYNNRSVYFIMERGYWIPVTKRGIPYLITIDGRLNVDPGSRLMDVQDLLQMEPSFFEKVYFSFDSPTISARLLGGRTGGLSPPPVMAIYTRKGSSDTRYNPSVGSYEPKGYDPVKTFYSPKYGSPEDSQLADLRNTIYWDPSIVTGKDGKAQFNFFNADQTGTYRIVIEGINSAGELGRKVYRYQVN